MAARVLGSTRGGAPLDIIQTCQWTLEVGRESANGGSIGHLDIANFHDSIGHGESFKTLKKRKVPQFRTSALVKCAALPKLKPQVGKETSPVLERNSGALTGSSIAGY